MISYYTILGKLSSKLLGALRICLLNADEYHQINSKLRDTTDTDILQIYNPTSTTISNRNEKEVLNTLSTILTQLITELQDSHPELVSNSTEQQDDNNNNTNMEDMDDE